MKPDQIASSRGMPERIILFDGVCDLCNGFVRFVVHRDPEARFRFAPLQSAIARPLLEGRLNGEPGMDTVVYVRRGRILVRSAAALHILRDLGGVWTLSLSLMLVPRPLRDAVYRWVARNRYRWFGRSESCMVPTSDLRNRFLGQ